MLFQPISMLDPNYQVYYTNNTNTLCQDYLTSLGKARTAQVQKDARIGEAQYKRDAVIREAQAMQEKVSAQYLNEIEMAKAQRDYELKKASYDYEVNTKKAESEMAYQLQVSYHQTLGRAMILSFRRATQPRQCVVF